MISLDTIAHSCYTIGMQNEYTIYTIDGSRNGLSNEYQVAHWHTYPKSSVLAGQEQEVIDGFYPTIEAALKDYPGAEVAASDEGRCTHKPEVSVCPPSDFDPHFAGECWHEDDY